MTMHKGNRSRGQFGNPEEGERPPLETATKQLRLRRLYVCCSDSDLRSVQLSETVVFAFCVTIFRSRKLRVQA
jgi:hypothetical protein